MRITELKLGISDARAVRTADTAGYIKAIDGPEGVTHLQSYEIDTPWLARTW